MPEFANPLPPSSKIVLRILGTNGAMTHKDIVIKSHCAPRTVRYALRRLKEHELIIEKANIRDMRQIIYQERKAWQQETRMSDREPGHFGFAWPKNSSSPVNDARMCPEQS